MHLIQFLYIRRLLVNDRYVEVVSFVDRNELSSSLAWALNAISRYDLRQTLLVASKSIID